VPVEADSATGAPLDLATRRRSLAYLDHLGRVARNESEAVLETLGLRPRHLVALTLLTQEGEVAQQTLKKILQLDASNLVGLLNELEARGLIERARSTQDRRRHTVRATAAGTAALTDADRLLTTVETRLLSALETGERAEFLRLVQKVAQGRTSRCHETD
jgi:DNA-binding MarR family transcriptional regulator